MIRRHRALRALKWTSYGLSLAILSLWALSAVRSLAYVTPHREIDLAHGRIAVRTHHLPFPFHRSNGLRIGRHVDFKPLDFGRLIERDELVPGGYRQTSIVAWPLVVSAILASLVIRHGHLRAALTPAAREQLSRIRWCRWAPATICFFIGLSWLASWGGWRIAFEGTDLDLLIAEKYYSGIRVRERNELDSEFDRGLADPGSESAGLGGKLKNVIARFRVEPLDSGSRLWKESIGLGPPLWGKIDPASSTSRITSNLASLGYVGAPTAGSLGQITAKSRVFLIPHWMILSSAFAVTTVIWLRSRSKHDTCCIFCGYDLSHNISGRCPECGTPLSAAMKSAVAEAIGEPTFPVSAGNLSRSQEVELNSQ